MTNYSSLDICCRFVLRLAFVGCCIASGALGQQSDDSFDIVRFLTYQSLFRFRSPGDLVLETCGVDARGREDRAALNSLIELGGKAVPALEQAFDSLEGNSWQSPYATNNKWLLYAYARIKGATAFPRLWKLGGNYDVDLLGLNLDDALALSLNLTSYISSLRSPLRIFRCHEQQPRDALDLLVLAWERDDLQWLETTLGPHASAALNSSLAGKTWSQLRSELWPGAMGARVAVGYRFAVPGYWSEPEALLQIDQRELDGPPDTEAPTLDTTFTNKAGVVCGSYRLSFVRAPMPAPPGYLKYLVDNRNPIELFRVIANCAAR